MLSYAKNLNDSVNVYILDSGMDLTNFEQVQFLMKEAPIEGCHEDKTSGYGFVTNQRKISTNFKDNHGHGTYGYRAITDVIEEKNSIKVIPIKIFNEQGEGSLFHFVCGLFHSIDNDADIINISAGFKDVKSSILETALQLAQKKGIFIIAAAGNDGIDIDEQPQYPAYYAGQFYNQKRLDIFGNIILNDGQPIIDLIPYDNIISIAALNSENQLSNFSNFGFKSVTLSAYGENLFGYGLNGEAIIYSGTSMATFYTTCELAIEISKNKDRTYRKIWKDFEENMLVLNENTIGKTITGKQINVVLEELNFERNKITQNQNNLKIYPNPSNEKINIEFNDNNFSNNSILKMKIFNILGDEVFNQKILDRKALQFDISII